MRVILCPRRDLKVSSAPIFQKRIQNASVTSSYDRDALAYFRAVLFSPAGALKGFPLWFCPERKKRNDWIVSSLPIGHCSCHPFITVQVTLLGLLLQGFVFRCLEWNLSFSSTWGSFPCDLTSLHDTILLVAKTQWQLLSSLCGTALDNGPCSWSV